MPRVGLNRDRVVAEAALVADEVGFDRLSLAAIAARLGVRLPSLYKHIDSLDGLRRDLAVATATEIATLTAEAVAGRSGETGLRAFAAAWRDFARRFPGRYATTVRAPAADDAEHAAAAEAVLVVVLDVLAGYRLTGDDAIDATRALRAALHGFVSLEAAGGFGLPHDVDRSFSRMVDGLHEALCHWPASGAD